MIKKTYTINEEFRFSDCGLYCEETCPQYNKEWGSCDFVLFIAAKIQDYNDSLIILNVDEDNGKIYRCEYCHDFFDE